MFHFHYLCLTIGSLCKKNYVSSGTIVASQCIVQLVYCCNMTQLVWYHLVTRNSDLLLLLLLLLLVSHVCLQRGVRKGWEMKRALWMVHYVFFPSQLASKSGIKKLTHTWRDDCVYKQLFASVATCPTKPTRMGHQDGDIELGLTHKHPSQQGWR